MTAWPRPSPASLQRARASAGVADAPGPLPRVAVVQDGARLHYALPVALQRAGLLERVFTEWYAEPGSTAAAVSRWVGRVSPALGARMAGRASSELDPRRVVRNPLLMLRQQASRRRFRQDHEYYRWSSGQVARWVLRHGWGAANCLAGFVRNVDPALLAAARRDGLATVADQMIAPAAVEAAEAKRQQERWPGWEPVAPQYYDSYRRLEEETWASLDHVTCASSYVAEGLVAQGVAPERVSLIPYPVARPVGPADDAGAARPRANPGERGPVTVGFVGAVNLRKGAPYVFRAAREFDPARVRFVMVGPVTLERDVAERQRGHVELVGGVPRSEVTGWLSRFDLFFFPSTCEGSAGAVMEAMSAGLPVVTTPNSGTVARDGVEGFVTAYDDTARQVARIRQLCDDPDLRRRMGEAARARAATTFDLDGYSRELAAVFRRVVQAPAAPPAAAGG